MQCLQAAAGAPAEEFSARVQAVLAAGQHPYLQKRSLQQEVQALRSLYEKHGYGPVWLREAPSSAPAQRMVQMLENAGAYGLRPEAYDAQLLQTRVQELASHSVQAAVQADLDLALSTVVLRFMRHVHGGRVSPSAADFNLNGQRAEPDWTGVMERLATAQDVAPLLAGIEPPFNHYRLLKTALVRYRELAADSSLTALPSFAGRSVKPGERYAGAPALRRLLTSLGDLQAAGAQPTAVDVLDESLVAGLRNFQERHGLTADGALGKQTLAELSKPLTARIHQIELTLERWRWLPPFESPPIIVNIPQFRLFALQTVEDREEGMLNMEVVVGKSFEGSNTPVFLGDMKYLVFRPYWDVPYTITVKELMPKLQADPGYLARNHFELVRGQGDLSPVVPPTPENIAALKSRAVRIRQLPGPDNALGNVKFMLPNTYNVYLHDTSARRLFKESRRAFSHGCIRVSDPAGLAAYVLQQAADKWPPERIAQALEGEPNQRVNLARSIRVMILYGTAMATESGRIFFFEDIYGHDRRLDQLLVAARQ